jgi:hypothetical protein
MNPDPLSWSRTKNPNKIWGKYMSPAISPTMNMGVFAYDILLQNYQRKNHMYR